MAGKPFPKVTAEQRAQFLASLSDDGVDLLKAAGRGAFEHLRDNPDSPIAQTLIGLDRDTGAVTAVTRGIATIMRERQRAKAAAAQPASEPKSESESAPDKG